ncbi:uncharacterized protein Z518_01762 [Rhinocladiella mackenziei CBS 650.93]|uniref:Uncharacterized protein n=1 Tax=Rhinocladiella mackenziei CBS 650.93 TaxID=1442369 RepID=A0A0D2HJ35_9EURO|nr:uncharacterized protein Z518_01762 [Rhinocladiella mackenziei CBS 650.93]KIX10678.1 hypothetical protein Z518_01762 [Rhinocladiella mackenziei CBS 650.93]
MNRFFLFCTADLSTEVIDDFLKTASDKPGVYHVKWILIRTPDQPTSREPTTPPVAPFKTGFMSASVATLGNHIAVRCYEAELAGDKMPDFQKSSFGVLDERSARDRTLLFVQRHSWLPQEALSLSPLDAAEAELDAWQTMRVKFEKALYACAMVPERPWCFFDEIGRDLCKVEDDVWDLPSPF